MKHILLPALLVAGVVALAAQPTARLARLPLQKTPLKFESPTTYQMQERVDPKTGKTLTYDPKPRVVILNARTGLIGFKWIGADGREKTVVYQRADTVDAIVRASMARHASGLHEYVYEIESLASGGTKLSGFVVQSFAADATPIAQRDLHIGRMSARGFEDGRWTDFAPLPGFTPAPLPGSKVTFRLTSSAQPALVRCRVDGGSGGTTGGEMPPELLALLPGYSDWPHGYTIGPDDRLAALSPAQRAQKLLEWLPEFERLGWMTTERRRHYDTGARRGDLRALATEAEADLRAERITTEVRAILQGFVTTSQTR